MRTLSFRQSTCIYTVAIAMGLILVLAATDCVYADESLDQMLSAAMENHPDIVAARARVALAEAELNATRLQVARQIIALWGERNAQRITMDSIRKELTEIQNQPPERRNMLNKNMQDAAARLEQIEAEMKFLTAKAAPVAPQGGEVGLFGRLPPQLAQPKPLQIPSGPIVEKFTPSAPIEIDFVDTPLEKLIAYMRDYLNFPIFLDNRPLNDMGISPDTPITLTIHKTPLAAAIQAIQDQNPELEFVIRDYGILITTKDQAKMQGYFPALEFAKSIGKEKSPEASPGPDTYNPVGR
jgi:hypothetical protein